MLWGPGGRYRITTIVFWAVITDHNSIRRVLLCTTCHQPGHPAHRCPDIGKKVCSTRETTTLTTATLNLPAPSPFSHLLFPCIFRAGGASDDDSEMICALGPRRTLSSTSPLSSSGLSSQTTTPSSSKASSSQTTLQSPSRSTTQDAGAGRRCGQCHRTGHNVRTCPSRLVQVRRHCRSCQQPGHDARTCPSRLVQARQHCRSCQQPGHNARNCPNRLTNGQMLTCNIVHTSELRATSMESARYFYCKPWSSCTP